MSDELDNLSIATKHKLSARPSMILEEPSLSVKGNWMQQANQRLLLRMARFTEEDKQRMQDCIYQCRQVLIQTQIVSLTCDNTSGIFQPFQRLKRKNVASQMTNCPNPKSDQRNCDINAAIKSKFWTFSRKPIRQSLIRSTKKDTEKGALKIFHIISGYANHSGRFESDSDSDSSIKATHQTYLIQSLLEKALLSDELKDEVYLQLIKQTTDNNDMVGGTNLKYWHLLSVVCNVLKPHSQEILDYLEAHFKICGIDSTTEEGRYSIYCQKCLNRTTEKSTRSFIASTKEINAVVRRQCIKLKIYLCDGSYRKVEVNSHTPNAEMVKMMKNKVGFKQETHGWSIFEQIDQTEKHCNPKELVSDMIFRWESLINSGKFSPSVYLIYKKRIFEEDCFNKSDNIEIKLLTHQCISDIFEDRLKVTQSQAAEICALRQLQEDCDPCISLRILPRYMRPSISKILILQIANNIRGQSDFTIEGCNLKILMLCKKCDPFGAFHYPISQYSMSIWPTEMILSINRRGLYFAARSSNTILLFSPFTDIIRYSFQPIGFLTFTLKHEEATELKMFSNLAHDISSLIHDYMVDQQLSEIQTSVRSSNGITKTGNMLRMDHLNSVEADYTSYSMASLPITISKTTSDRCQSNIDDGNDDNDDENEVENVGYLNDYLDSFSIQSDDVFVHKNNEQPTSVTERNNHFDFSAQLANVK